MLLRRYDKTPKGKLDLQEFTELVRDIESGVIRSQGRGPAFPVSARVSAAFDAFDVDHSGFIEYRELRAALRHYGYDATEPPEKTGTAKGIKFRPLPGIFVFPSLMLLIFSLLITGLVSKSIALLVDPSATCTFSQCRWPGALILVGVGLFMLWGFLMLLHFWWYHYATTWEWLEPEKLSEVTDPLYLLVSKIRLRCGRDRKTIVVDEDLRDPLYWLITKVTGVRCCGVRKEFVVMDRVRGHWALSDDDTAEPERTERLLAQPMMFFRSRPGDALDAMKMLWLNRASGSNGVFYGLVLAMMIPIFEKMYELFVVQLFKCMTNMKEVTATECCLAAVGVFAAIPGMVASLLGMDAGEGLIESLTEEVIASSAEAAEGAEAIEVILGSAEEAAEGAEAIEVILESAVQAATQAAGAVAGSLLWNLRQQFAANKIQALGKKRYQRKKDASTKIGALVRGHRIRDPDWRQLRERWLRLRALMSTAEAEIARSKVEAQRAADELRRVKRLAKAKLLRARAKATQAAQAAQDLHIIPSRAEAKAARPQLSALDEAPSTADAVELEKARMTSNAIQTLARVREEKALQAEVAETEAGAQARRPSGSSLNPGQSRRPSSPQRRRRDCDAQFVASKWLQENIEEEENLEVRHGEIFGLYTEVERLRESRFAIAKQLIAAQAMMDAAMDAAMMDAAVRTAASG